MSHIEKPAGTQAEQPQTTKTHERPSKDQADGSTPAIHHEHAVIHPVPAGVTHIDPGAVVL